MISRVERLQRGTQFALIGGGVFAIGWLLQLVLVHAGINDVAAFTIQLLLTVVLNHDLNRAITWRDREHDVQSALKFFASRGATLLMSWLIFVTLVDRLGINHLAANPLSVVLGMTMNYVFSDKLAFAPTPDKLARLTSWAEYKPVRNALRRGYRLVKPLTLVLVIALYWNSWIYPNLLWVTAVLAFTAATIEYRWRTYTKRSAQAVEEMKFVDPATYTGKMLKFSLIFSAVNEAEILAHSIRMALSTGYPSELVEIAVTLRHDQPETIAAVEEVRKEFPELVTVYVNEYKKGQKKSAQMNAVLSYLTGDYLTVVDAESKFQPGQLAATNATINTRGITVFQGGVTLTNLENKLTGSWLTKLGHYAMFAWYVVHNSMEYWTWFGSRMFFQISQQVVALGGNTVFMPVPLVRDDLGGWNDARLTEDADMGIKLSVDHDVVFGAAFEPRYATQEHTPPKIFGKGSLFKQRVRWDQGFWQVLRDYRWLRFPTFKQRLLALYVLATPLLQAASAVYIIGGVVQLVVGFYDPSVRPPLIVTMIEAIPVYPMIKVMLLQLTELPGFCRAFGHKLKLRYALSLIIMFLPFQIILGGAGIVAVIRQALGIESWSLTARNKEAHAAVPQIAVQGLTLAQD